MFNFDLDAANEILEEHYRKLFNQQKESIDLLAAEVE